jgi:hypothetical protein
MGCKDQCLKECPKPYCPIISKEKATKYMPLKLLSQPKFAFYQNKYVYFNGKSEEPLENLKTSHVPFLITHPYKKNAQYIW